MSVKTYQSKGRVIHFDEPRVMGILNITPNSFYDGGRYFSQSAIFDRIDVMVNDGADMIDIGGMSTKPGSPDIDIEEEWRRIEGAISHAVKASVIVSVDTVKAEIARRASEMGVHVINDISAGEMDSEMLATVGGLDVVYVAMHMQGTPQTMQSNPTYDTVTLDILKYFARKKREFDQYGISQWILDPGFGFGKTIEQNYTLLGGLSGFKIFDLPLLVGLSRKSMIYKVLDQSPEDVLPGTLGIAMAALERGANILRVHDVSETIQVVKIFNQLRPTDK